MIDMLKPGNLIFIKPEDEEEFMDYLNVPVILACVKEVRDAIDGYEAGEYKVYECFAVVKGELISIQIFSSDTVRILSDVDGAAHI